MRNALASAAPLSYAPLAQDLGVSETEAAAASERGFEHPDLGPIHPAHIPLPYLASHFPNCWSALKDSHSFALIRDPRSRFLSALMQRLKEFKGATDIRAEDALVQQEAEEVCNWLSVQNSAIAQRDFIHFARQIDFIDCDNRRVLTRIFPVTQAQSAADWLQAVAGLSLEITHQHSRRQPKTWARGVVPVARYAAQSLMPRAVKKALHPVWMKSGIFDTAAKGYGAVRFSDNVEQFIQDHYQSDWTLFEEANAATRTTGQPTE